MNSTTPQRLVGHKLLSHVLQERIEQGHYAPGSWLPAERALAQEFGVDRSAIRRALSQLETGGLIVREAGRRPWVRRDQPLPFNGQSSRREGHVALRTIVAILPQHPQYPASLGILHGINAAVRQEEAPFRLQVMDTHGGSESSETELERRALEAVAREGIAGVVLWHMGGEHTLPQLQAMQRRGTPIVFVDRFPSGIACDYVGSDNRSGVEEAIAYLRQLGHRRIAHLTTDEQTTAVLERTAAFRAAMQASDAEFRQEMLCTLPHDATMEVSPAYRQFFTRPDPPTAVLAMNDSLAYRLIEECERHGMMVPQDLSVIGIDDLEGYSPRPSVLTTLHQPFDKMGRRAAELLLRRIAEPTAAVAKQHILLPTPLVVRSTCQRIS